MNKFLIGQDEELNELLIVNALDPIDALDKYIDFLEPNDSFLEYLHDWSINGGFSSKFHYDEKSQGQQNLSLDLIHKNVKEYFQDKEEYCKIYFQHWNNEVDADQDESEGMMATFPDKMIMWIWEKELKEGDWTSFKVIELDAVDEI